MPSLSRRGILRSAAALAGGIGVAGGARAATADAATPGPLTGLVLTATGLASLTAKAVAGDVVTSAGALAHGDEAGQVYVTRTVLSRQRLLTRDAGSLESHVFVLPGGTLTGSGVLHHDGTGVFAVTGGTGAFLGARGSYTARESREFGGTTATYEFTGAN